MNPVRNALEFRQNFANLRGEYEKKFGPLIAKVRDQYLRMQEATPSGVEDNLEAHIRVYLTNAFLSALNWRVDDSVYGMQPTILPEVVIKSLLTGRRRYLDYLGFEADRLTPLLIVETKAPRAALPRRSIPAGTGTPASLQEYRGMVASDLVYGLTDGSLIGEWNEWLTTLKDYVNSVHQKAGTAPLRVLITNGDWALIFLNPMNTFVRSKLSPEDIMVLETKDALESSYCEVYEALDFHNVSGEIPYLSVNRLPFHLDSKSVSGVLHGLRLRYIEQTKLYSESPVITLAPILFLKTTRQTWITVEGPQKEYEIPHDAKRLAEHLETIEQAAVNLLKDSQARLRVELAPTPLAVHYEDSDAFAKLPGVRIKMAGTEFLISTGDKTHYLLPEPTVPECRFHAWIECQNEGVAAVGGPLMTRLIQPRSFFMNEERHHCAHRYVDEAKNSALNEGNINRCGLRSGNLGHPFCEIAPFETRLCCRTCVFEEVCTHAEVFHLPCRRPN